MDLRLIIETRDYHSMSFPKTALEDLKSLARIFEFDADEGKLQEHNDDGCYYCASYLTVYLRPRDLHYQARINLLQTFAQIYGSIIHQDGIDRGDEGIYLS